MSRNKYFHSELFNRVVELYWPFASR